MKVAIILSALGLIGASVAAPADIEDRQAREQPLLRLYDIPGITSGGGTSSFTGRGAPGKCQNFPYNIDGFKRADAAYGYECDIYTEKNCRGSSLTVGTPIPEAFRVGEKKPDRPTWQSWVCFPLDDDPFPSGPH
jgi:hypothetical protein